MHLHLKFVYLLFGLLVCLDIINLTKGQFRRSNLRGNRYNTARSPFRNIRTKSTNLNLSRQLKYQAPSSGRNSNRIGVTPNNGQFFQRSSQPHQIAARRPASVSIANQRADSKNIGIGDYIDLNSGRTNTRTVSKTNGGIRNGGTTSISKSNAQTQGINLGGLGISNTVTQTKTNANGQVSRGVANNFNVGGLDIGSSVSRDNLKNIGLHRNSDGSVGFGLGLLDFDIGHKANPAASGDANAASSATASGQRTKANANAKTNSHDYGLIDVNSAHTNSRAVGISRNGQSSAAANGQANTQSKPQPSLPIFGSFLGRRKRDLRIQQYTDDLCCYTCPSCQYLPSPQRSEALISPLQFPNFSPNLYGGLGGLTNGLLGNGLLGSNLGLGNGVIDGTLGLANGLLGNGLNLGNGLLGNGLLGNGLQFANGIYGNGLQLGNGVLGTLGNPLFPNATDARSSFLNIGNAYQTYSSSATRGTLFNEYIIQEYNGHDGNLKNERKILQPSFIRKMNKSDVDIIDESFKKKNRTKEEQNVIVGTPQSRTFGFIFDLFTTTTTTRPIVVPIPIPYPQPIPQRPTIIGCCNGPRPNMPPPLPPPFPPRLPPPPPPYPLPYPGRSCCRRTYPCSGCRYLPPLGPGSNSITPYNGFPGAGINPYNYGDFDGAGFGNGFGIGSNLGSGIGFGGNFNPGIGSSANIPGINNPFIRTGISGFPGVLGVPGVLNNSIPQSATSSFGSIGNVSIGSSSANIGSLFSAILAILG